MKKKQLLAGKPYTVLRSGLLDDEEVPESYLA